MPCGVSLDQDGNVSPVLGAAQSMALITSLQVALEPGPSGHIFTGFLGEQGPSPFHQSSLLLPVISRGYT